MIKGLMMTPPVVGRISIGRIVERNGKRLPQKDDEFTITTQVQNRNGWMLHPIDGILRKELADRQLMITGVTVRELAHLPPEFTEPAPASLRSKLAKRASGSNKITGDAVNGGDVQGANVQEAQTASAAGKIKLRSIPVRLLFNDPELNLRANYTLFDRPTARPVCVGDGQACKRMTAKGIESMQCKGPDLCALAIDGGCKPFGRFHVRIDHPGCQADALSTFVLRTTGINSMRTLLTRMQYLQAVSGGLLAYLPLEIRLRAKSTNMSHRAPIYYVDVGIRDGMALDVAIAQAVDAAEHDRRTGRDQDALEHAARSGYALGLFEELEQEATEIVQEFYPTDEQSEQSNGLPIPKRSEACHHAQ
nr:phage capsid protein [Comamonas koreensis]